MIYKHMELKCTASFCLFILFYLHKLKQRMEWNDVVVVKRTENSAKPKKIWEITYTVHIVPATQTHAMRARALHHLTLSTKIGCNDV